jgi:phenylacetate-coenzyme A ligase PaaK-like adenylate-forming protein
MLARKRLVALAARAKNSPLIDVPLRYLPAGHGRAVRQIEAFRDAPLGRRHELSDRLTDAALERARRTRYGRRFDGQLDGWPILEKDAIRRAPDDFTNAWRVRIPAATGGTTGVPLPLWRSLGCVAAEQAFLDDVLGRYNLTLGGARVVVLRGDIVKDPGDRTPPFGMMTHWGRRLVLSGAHMGRDTIDWYVDTLRKFRPDVIVTYPNQALNLTRLAGAGTLEIPLVMTSSETLTTPTRREVEAGLGARVIDYYGQAERVCLAVGPEEDSYCFVPAYGRVELIPAADDPIDGKLRHVRIIATSYWNDAMALVRYDTGDRAVVPADASAETLDAIAMGAIPFHGLAGRIDEFVLAPDGTRLCGLNQLPRELPDLLQIQVVQEARDLVRLRVLAGPGFDDAQRRQLLRNAHMRLPPPIKVNLEVVEALERNSAGKTPLVIRRLQEMPERRAS